MSDEKICPQCRKAIEGDGVQKTMVAKICSPYHTDRGWRFTFRNRRDLTRGVGEKTMVFCSEDCGLHHQMSLEG